MPVILEDIGYAGKIEIELSCIDSLAFDHPRIVDAVRLQRLSFRVQPRSKATISPFAVGCVRAISSSPSWSAKNAGQRLVSVLFVIEMPLIWRSSPVSRPSSRRLSSSRPATSPLPAGRQPRRRRETG